MTTETMEQPTETKLLPMPEIDPAAIAREMERQDVQAYVEYCEFLRDVREGRITGNSAIALAARKYSVTPQQVADDLDRQETKFAELSRTRQMRSDMNDLIDGPSSGELRSELQKIIDEFQPKIEAAHNREVQRHVFRTTIGTLPNRMFGLCKSELLNKLSAEHERAANQFRVQADHTRRSAEAARDEAANARIHARRNKQAGFDVSGDEAVIERLERSAAELDERVKALDAAREAERSKVNSIHRLMENPLSI